MEYNELIKELYEILKAHPEYGALRVLLQKIDE
jgi:hypothetical protein